MKKLYLFSFFFLLTVCGYTQNSVIKGVVRDTIADSKIPKAAVTLFNYSDSVLVKFTRTNSQGEYRLEGIKPGKYVVLISHPVFANSSDVVEVKDEPEIDMGIFPVFSQEYFLKEVTIISADAIRIKGDTIEYVADSFKVKQNATVEDLLKKLPGIQVNKNGEITAQGKRVEKVLVDGDEFFSDDPKVATQNLKAESVETVQVFEKKDELSSGTDQGTQTINITLKEDAKKGAFGKLKGGAGTDDGSNLFYDNAAMINKFKPKQKASAYVLHSNTGKLNLDWQENQQYGSGGGNQWFDDDNGFVFYNNNTDEDEFVSYGNGYQGAGIPAAISAGANFDRKWNKDIHHVNGSYQFKHVDNDALTSITSQNFLADTSFLKNESVQNLTNNTRHNLNFFYDVKTDSLSHLKWSVKGNKALNKKDNFYGSTTLNEDNDTVNTNNRVINTDTDVTNFSTDANWTKQFKRNPEQKLNIIAEYSNKNTQSESFLNSRNRIFMADNVLLFSDTTDQQKTVNRVEQNFRSQVTYKQPLSKTSVLEFRYSFALSNQVADRFTFDKSNSGEYINRLDSLSSQYVYDVTNQRGGLNYHFKKNKASFKIGSDISNQVYNQQDKLNDTSLNRSFINFYPVSSFVYSFNKMHQIRINYNGNMEQPALAYIQPLRDNSDPFNITVGNPNLDPSFKNSGYIQYFNNQVLKGRYLFFFVNFSHTSNAVVSSTSVDAFNRTITKYVNASGVWNTWAQLNYYMELKKVDMSWNIAPSTYLSQNVNFINSVKNVTTNKTFTINTELNKDIGEWFYAGLDYQFNYNISGSTIQEGAQIKYWTQSFGPEVNISFLKDRLSFETDVDYNLRQRTQTFNENNNIFLWNAGINLKTFKDKSGLLTLYVNDILNQNRGFQRNASAYSITETRYNVIRRYAMISFTWNFNTQKPKGVEEKKD